MVGGEGGEDQSPREYTLPLYGSRSAADDYVEKRRWLRVRACTLAAGDPVANQ